MEYADFNVSKYFAVQVRVETLDSRGMVHPINTFNQKHNSKQYLDQDLSSNMQS